MRKAKQNKLEQRGWRVGDTVDFLGLSPRGIRARRYESISRASNPHATHTPKAQQAEFAKLTGSSQSRVAKMEAADTSVSLDLLVRSLLALGASRRDIADAIATKTRAVA